MNPVEEFLEYDRTGMEKTAQAPVSWATRHPLAATAITGVATPLALMAAHEGYQEVKGMIGRARGFKRMMDYNPGLKKLPATKTKAMFNTLHNAAPDLAKDPVVASSWVNRMALQDEYVDPRTLADLGSAQQKVQRPGLDLPVGQITAGMMTSVKDQYADPLNKQLDRAQRSEASAATLAQQKKQHEFEKAKGVAAEARAEQLHASKLQQQQQELSGMKERQQQELGHREGKYQAAVQRLDAAGRADRARARWYNKQGK